METKAKQTIVTIKHGEKFIDVEVSYFLTDYFPGQRLAEGDLFFVTKVKDPVKAAPNDRVPASILEDEEAMLIHAVNLVKGYFEYIGYR
ncbi:MAG: hypothetical protein EOO14_18700 [Chitinophagaceae bacterium]|nr:MAG: hypothetical protein EOO14_18700 [Chitinophagaceae bacterium]